ncbi:gp107 [Mycobacterium phage Corndog]|uniref:2TM domain-containing protein n=1 Tax=Mycobacterium phage Corndog TaxID=205875 RepID=Q856I7_BPMCO|nr:gp107 [Mycobacterium phage Corndog]AAN02039.1 hypothetical protein PBI_CORNDOG_107 [Mycobacterium phage Corndog]WUT94756.1 hypothetical protein SUAREZ_108 [Mycobacterium phage Suarez]
MVGLIQLKIAWLKVKIAWYKAVVRMIGDGSAQSLWRYDLWAIPVITVALYGVLSLFTGYFSWRWCAFWILVHWLWAFRLYRRDLHREAQEQAQREHEERLIREWTKEFDQ